MRARLRLAGGIGLAVITAACAGAVPQVQTSAPSANQVVVVSAAGRPATATPAGATPRQPPTPTFEVGFGSILTPLAQVTAVTTGTPLASGSPTPLIRPTRTVEPTYTPFPTVEIPPTSTRAPVLPPPTRTPQPSPTPRPGAPTRVPTFTATAVPADPTGNNGDIARAQAITPGRDVVGLLNSPSAVDVFSFTTTSSDDQAVITLTAQDVAPHRLYLITPGRRQAAFATKAGTTAKQIRYPIQGEVGTWYVEVSADGTRAPRGGYTLRVELIEAEGSP